jgi:hypothetical protein
MPRRAATAEVNQADNVHRFNMMAAPETPDIPQQTSSLDDAPPVSECIPARRQVVTDLP